MSALLPDPSLTRVYRLEATLGCSQGKPNIRDQWVVN